MIAYTVQISQWRAVKALGIPFIDTTVRSGLRIFAPTWEMVMGHKDETMHDEEYTMLYSLLMDKSQEASPQQWAFHAGLEKVAFACYCKAGVFCHRHLLVERFRLYCKKHDIPFQYGGEITKDGIVNVDAIERDPPGAG